MEEHHWSNDHSSHIFLLENETENAQPKRKRRRKRPRTHAAATVVIVTQSIDAAGDVGAPASILNAQASEGTLEHFVSTQTVSSRRKRRSKSTPASATASSSSLLSAPLDINGLQTPSVPRTKDKEFLVPPASLSRAASKKKKEVPTITILRRPEELLTRSNARSDDDDSDFDGERTPTNFGIMQSDASRAPELGVPINLTGKKGNRVGRREREKEKSKYDATREHEAAKEGGASVGTDKTFDFDNDSDENDEDGVESQDDEDEEQGDDNDSLSNLSLLKPPRRRRRRRARDTAYIHTGTGNAGSYRSIPGTPGFLLSYPDGQANDGDERVVVDGGSKQSTAEDDNNSQSKASVATEKRKRTRRRLKAVKSVPDLMLETDIAGPSISTPAAAAAIVAEDRTQQAVIKATRGRLGAELLGSRDPLDMDRNPMQQYLLASGSGIILMNSPPEPKKLPPPDSKRGRLLALARQLRQLFPEQSEDLGRIIQRIENPSTAQGGKPKRVVTSDTREEFEAQTGASRPKRRRARKGGHAKTESESGTGPTGGDVFEFEDEQGDVLQDGDGGTSHMPEVEEEEEDVDPRGRPPRRSDTALVHVFIDHSNILIGLLSHLKKNQNRRNAMNKTRSRPLPALISKATAASGASNKTDAASAFAAVKASSSRPLPIPSNGDAGTKPVVPVEVNPIPLPSFATMSYSLPTTSVLNSYMTPRNGPSDDEAGRENNSDGHEYPCKTNDESGALAPAKGSKDKRMLKHLWHAALVLILERGRPVTRRVVVASSPLYQPMESIEQLGYELRVYLRVPDLGDGQDRERYRDKSTAGKSNGSSKSAQSSPTTATSSSGIPYTKRTHVRNISGNVSTESGSGAGSGNASGGLHPYYGTPNTNLANTSRVKYREQGVDELLQLKLHQAIAASETVPEGSTIVLATGDGNVSQFTEDGFLGPVRTALRRGWKVELYAWEDGLSRAWRREFGDRSDWGQRGLFRVIEMEQFADALVEAVEQSSD
ncbi:hypothetical protein BDN70DRAFT_118625 [Pholiota conissans]|uniref:Uncharacterized protein n=1 Tax=Pholiota conissans TaxID=109636 RepID=A0A9P5YXD8_9AGAR|nr:hypothetical protein BDN70DRAFT_118625 [Pholiota conissans]